jgi:two-component system, cell cycle sensor histidine kinase and response regulator CckA
MPESPRHEPEVLHQLKNHLVVVVGFAELLLSEFAPDDPRRDDMLQIREAAAAAMALLPSLDSHLRKDEQ